MINISYTSGLMSHTGYSLMPNGFIQTFANPIQTLFKGPSTSIFNPNQILNEKEYTVFIVKKDVSSISDAIIANVSRNIESIFAAEDVTITEDVRKWIQKKTREVMLRILTE